jgi:hypothetical protein
MTQEDGEISELDRALDHPIRRDLIRLLWHLGDSATADQIRTDPPGEDFEPVVVAYHCRVLERANVIEVDGESDPIRPAYWIGGENADEATQRLKLWK